jgi:hypothetical protein
MRRRNTLDPFRDRKTMSVTVTGIKLDHAFDGAFKVTVEGTCDGLVERLMPPKQRKPRGGYRHAGNWKPPATLDFTDFHVPPGCAIPTKPIE